MSCCDDKENGCHQGRDCELHDRLAEQRMEFLNNWVIENYGLVSNAAVIIIAVFVALILLTK